ncbi:FAD/NAD(P)-binding domain-containing protein [Cadophora sp. DSE1049]|nr:FAD/NAD(P)-binding domain-containing protein [Cadophora sp. DSE1049]
MKHIVILGGSYAGISTAHRILKQSSRTGPFKITLVSPNTHFFWSMASPRAVVPGRLTDEQLFQPIKEGFSKYPASQFEFILASAETLDVEAKKVGILSSAGKSSLEYDFLILATGSRTESGIPYKGLGSTDATKEALHNFQAQIKKAETIVVAGAGVTGCEAAGELAFEYGHQKKITLIATGPTVLPDVPASVSALTTKELQSLNVTIAPSTKVLSSHALPTGQHSLTLSTGQTLLTDMYIPTFGLLPNSSYIPSKFLAANGAAVVDSYLRVKGASDIWAIGDVSALEPPQFIVTNKQSAHLAKNIVALLSGKTERAYRVASPSMLRLSIGRKAGTGYRGDWRVPSFVIVFARRNLFLDSLGPMVDGSLF